MLRALLLLVMTLVSLKSFSAELATPVSAHWRRLPIGKQDVYLVTDVVSTCTSNQSQADILEVAKTTCKQAAEKANLSFVLATPGLCQTSASGEVTLVSDCVAKL